MINCVRDDMKTVVSASGGAPQVAADCCEVIRAIYFEIPVEMRPLCGLRLRPHCRGRRRPAG